MEKAQEVFEAAVQAEEAGDSDKAIRLYEQSSLLAPQHPLPLLRAAILLFTLSKWKQAIRVGRQVTNVSRGPIKHLQGLTRKGVAQLRESYANISGFQQKPISSKLIVDREPLPAIRKIYPRLSNVIRDEIGNLRTL